MLGTSLNRTHCSVTALAPPFHFLISPQAQPQPLTMLTSIGKTSISAGWRKRFQLKVKIMDTPSNIPANESELGG